MARGDLANARKQKSETKKRPRVEPAPPSTPADLPAPREAPLQQKVAKHRRIYEDCDDEEIPHAPEEVIERDLMGFCCYTCRCPDDKEDFMPSAEDEQVCRYVQSSPYSVYHRTCCHGVEVLPKNDEWASLYEAACERIGEPDYSDDDDDNDYQQHPDFRWVTKMEIYESYRTFRRQESAFYNADGDAHPLDRLMTHPDYMRGVVKPYNALCEKVQEIKDTDRRRVVVLDAFAGVGTGIVALKRLGIDIAKVIHVEHDKVATHVYRWNHDPTYNLDLPEDDIQHVFVEKWEQFEDDWRSLCDEHGPIDIILGGPPCADYSKVNAARKGAEGEQGQYLLSFGRRIREIERYQAPHPVFFLAENVFLSGSDLAEVRDAFGLDWDPIALDAQYLSPTRRNRHFFINIPLSDVDFTKEISMQGPTSCLEDGFVLPVHIVDREVTAKAQCLMASKTRIDEFQTLRMFVFKKEKYSRKKKKKYYGRPMQIIERENLMGYPVGYIQKPVEELFTLLVVDGHSRTLQSDEAWQVDLHEQYHTFAGNYHALPGYNPHRFEFKSKDEPHVFLRLAPPSQTPTFFNAEGYAKHLIGLAYSLPVAEVLLEPLKKLYKSRSYDRFCYSYAWESQPTDVLSVSINE